MKKLFLLLILMLHLPGFCMPLYESGPTPTAHFTAAEVQSPYYEMGWDSQEEAATWTYSRVASGNFSWHLEENTPYTGQPAFSSIDADSQYSLCVRYSNYDTQNERAISPAITVLPHTTLEFYACFRSVFLVYADWKMYILDEDENHLLDWSAFLWSQQNAFTGPTWQKFSFDLSDMADKNVKIVFLYTGPSGEDLAIDGLRLYQSVEDEHASITINEGDYVHFLDTSTGEPTSWQWTFEGGVPETSTEQNPIVCYPVAGTYSVSLTVSGAEDADPSTSNPQPPSTITREGYVNVVAQAPQALIGMPLEGYLSPWTALFLAPGQTVQYHDLSSGHPTSWQWTFEGGDPAESSEQNPVVCYQQEGVYGLTLDVANAAGSSSDFMKDAIQVGGSQYIWNIALDEYDSMDEISLGWYGYYAGSNLLGMYKFAEHFAAPPTSLPAPPAGGDLQSPTLASHITEVQVYFYGTETVSPDALITLQLCKEASNGEPGEVLAETSIRAGEIVYDQHTIVPTTFTFDHPVEVNEPFFVVIGPFPHNTDEDTGKMDAISILAVRRDPGAKSTTWHLLEDEDPRTHEPLGSYQWFENTDDPVSMCITPLLTYGIAEPTAIENVTTHHLSPITHHPSPIYDLQGRCVSRGYNANLAPSHPRTSAPSNTVSPLKKGVYIVNGRKVVLK